MASAKIIEQKANVVSEIKDKLEKANSIVLFDYRGLTVSEVTELRRKLRETGSDFKVYKNTLAKRAMEMLDMGVTDHLEGPTAISFSSDALAPVKVLAEFAKTLPALELKGGIVDGKETSLSELNELETVPTRDGLLTMFAAGLMEHVKNVAICLDLHSQNLEEENN